MNTKYITSIGYAGLRAKVNKLQQEYRDCLAEMQEVKDNCLSSEDSSELNHYRMMLDTIGDSIDKVQKLIDNAITVNVEAITTDKVVFGSLVTLENLDTSTISTYRVVSGFESNPKEGFISVNSPLGKELVGCLEGDVIDLRTPSGSVEYEIIEISK